MTSGRPADEMAIPGGLVRRWRIEDAPSLAFHANNANVARYMYGTFPSPYSEADARTYIPLYADESPPTDFAIEVAGEAVGAIGFRIGGDVHSRTATIGYWLGEAHWGRGIATNALRVVTRYAFTTFDLERLEAEVFASNAASARVLEKAGYVIEGRLRRRITKNGEAIDALLFGHIRPTDPS